MGVSSRLRKLKNNNATLGQISDFIIFRNSWRGGIQWAQSFKNKCPKNDLQLEIIGGKLISRKLLKSHQVVVSVGIGTDLDFDLGIIRRFGNRVIAIDPTDVSKAFVNRVSTANPKLVRKLKFINKALSIDGAPLHFYSGDGDRMATSSKKHTIGKNNSFIFPSVSIIELLEDYDVGYLKLDIEGYEYQMFEVILGRVRIPQIAIEFHHFCVSDLSITKEIDFINSMEKIGYDAYDFGSWAGRTRRLPTHVQLFKDLNVEILFVNNSLK
jgi:FkbM family methyltransferase